MTSNHRRLTRADVLVPLALVVLSLVPTFGGLARLLVVSGSAAPGPDDARFLAAPGPIVVHVFAATLYSLLGALQFSRGVRIRWPRWHRYAGRALALLGLLAAATGLWMTWAYAIPTGMQGPLLVVVRTVVASAMLASLVLGVRAILRRDVARHEAYMIRAYALGQGAGTQVLVLLPWMVITGNSTGLTRDVLMMVAWGINVVVAEVIIGQRAARVSRTGWVPTASRG